MVKEIYFDVALSILKLIRNWLVTPRCSLFFPISHVMERSEMELEIVHKIIKQATLKSQGIFDPLGTYTNFEMA